MPKEVNELIPGQINEGFSTQDLDIATQAMFDYVLQNKERTEGEEKKVVLQNQLIISE